MPTLVSRLVSFEDLEEYDLSSLQKVYVGAANSPPELVKAVEEKLGCRYVNAFGMVEGPCSQSARRTIPWRSAARPSAGPFALTTTFGPWTRRANPLPAAWRGSWRPRARASSPGYFRNPQANMQAFTPDGYFRTGDLAVIDESGSIRITGRIKDIIIRGGENIAARDVEDLISAHPAVEYVAVVGMPDPDLGEAGVCLRQARDRAARTLEEIVAHMKARGASKTILPGPGSSSLRRSRSRRPARRTRRCSSGDVDKSPRGKSAGEKLAGGDRGPHR